MKKESYEEIMKAIAEVNELLEKGVDIEIDNDYDMSIPFKWEYAYEGLTERNSVYKRRNSNG